MSLALATVLLQGPEPQQAPQPPPPQPPQQPSEIGLVIRTREPGVPPKYAVPDFVALASDAETQAAAKTIGQVLWDDLNFEREFYLSPRDTYASIPAARTLSQIPFDRWRELGADGLVMGTVQRDTNGLRVEVRLYDVRGERSVFGKEYTGSAANPRLYAHTISDEIHQNQRALRGVARSKLTFSSDRDAEKMAGTVENRNVKEIYITDYDGANARRVTVNRSLTITPSWSPDGRAIAYTSYKRGAPDVFISFIYQGKQEEPSRGRGQNFLPAWSPDGSRLAFMSNRDGNPDLYVMNADGGSVRRMTNHPAIDVTPTWSPNGNQIAFVSDRTGTPQIYVMDADGLGPARQLTHESYCDRPTWSPAPYNEIAYCSRTGPGFDIKVLDLASGERRQLTFGEGSNESPTFAGNGRHVAFSSTRAGKSQIFTIARDGKDLRQVTKTGNNFTPNWSR
ncbi:MAG: Tol-Pal system beta propeller repeat protein TolB [Acidobacteria bacterium]|nr:Tol-Pal system beta propeller repeat protein TolB [Acidobacteriota bacterium]